VANITLHLAGNLISFLTVDEVSRYVPAIQPLTVLAHSVYLVDGVEVVEMHVSKRSSSVNLIDLGPHSRQSPAANDTMPYVHTLM